MTLERHRVVIVDDHELVRMGLRSMLLDRGIDVVAEAETGFEGLKQIRQHQPHLALVDIRMPDMNGIELCQMVRSESLSTRIAILTSFIDKDVLHACLQTGIQGYLLKDAHSGDLLHSIEQILAGKSVLDPTMTTYAMKWLEERGTAVARSRDAMDLRDVEIFRLMAKGFTNSEIGQRLFLSENTVKVLINDLYRHLNVKTRVEAVMEAHRRGIL